MNERTSIYQRAMELCRELRRRSTPSEEKLWVVLRNRHFLHKKFLRQHPIFVSHLGTESFYIADFYCRDSKLVLEIDGKSHNYQKDYDDVRTEMINSLGIKVVRFTNKEIENHLSDVLERLKSVLVEQGLTL